MNNNTFVDIQQLFFLHLYTHLFPIKTAIYGRLIYQFCEEKCQMDISEEGGFQVYLLFLF